MSTWENANVWGSDFRDGPDMDPDGGSDAPDIYFFTGHGSCQQPPGANDPDFIVLCSTVGTPNFVDVGTSSRWGNGNGQAQFMFVDASCPMDLVSLSTNWFPTFVGLHVAVGIPAPPRRTRSTALAEAPSSPPGPPASPAF